MNLAFLAANISHFRLLEVMRLREQGGTGQSKSCPDAVRVRPDTMHKHLGGGCWVLALPARKRVRKERNILNPNINVAAALNKGPEGRAIQENYRMSTICAWREAGEEEIGGEHHLCCLARREFKPQWQLSWPCERFSS